MSAGRGIPPVWMMGLTNVTFSMMATFAIITVPQILAQQGVPGGHIAAITALVISPAWWVFLLAPILDVRFRRRTYALALGFLAAAAAACIAFDHDSLGAVEFAAFFGMAAASLYQGAVGGWMGSLIEKEQDGLLSSWFIAAGIAASGVMAMAGATIVLRLPRIAAAATLFGVIVLPMAFFIAIPAPPPDPLLASESFGRFWREVLNLFRRREVRIGLVLLGLPAGSFALSNVLAGIGQDYHTGPGLVSVLTGWGYVISGVAAMWLVPALGRRIALRPLYLGIGVAGAVFTLASLLLARTPFSFALVFTGELVFQTLAGTVAAGIIFEIIGRDNPLAATIFTLLISVMILPISYMGVVDGWGYDAGGLPGSFAVDAGFGLAACLLLALGLRRWLFAHHPEMEAAHSGGSASGRQRP